jgi:anti-sigma regulatory factor (Ser/Thr protein kinase)
MGFGAGMGLPNIKQNSDSFKISTEIGTGTRLEMRFDL